MNLFLYYFSGHEIDESDSSSDEEMSGEEMSGDEEVIGGDDEEYGEEVDTFHFTGEEN